MPQDANKKQNISAFLHFYSSVKEFLVDQTESLLENFT